MKLREKWPRLTAQVGIGGEVHPLACQLCGADHDLTRWEEHDGADRPEGNVVVLCEACGAREVERHPRLYRALDPCEPHPGSMELCVGCRWRDGVSCTHPDLRRNGGPGLAITFPSPSYAIVCGRRGGRRSSWRQTMWKGRPTDCAGRETDEYPAEAQR